MRTAFLLLTFSVLTVILPTASGEEKQPAPSPYLSTYGNAVRQSLSEEATLDKDADSLEKIEWFLSAVFHLRFRHSEASAEKLESMPSLKKRNRITLKQLLDELSAKLRLKWLLEYDGSILFVTAEEGVLLNEDPASDFDGETPVTPGNWRTRLAWALRGRITIGYRDKGKSLADIPWLFRYCPILSPTMRLSSITIDREYVHQPLGQVLEDILGRYMARIVPWGGALLVLPAGIPPGKEPSVDVSSLWRGKGLADDRLYNILDKKADTGLRHADWATNAELDKALSIFGRRVVFSKDTRKNKYCGIPAGEVEAGRMLAFIERFDGIKCAFGREWMLLYRGNEPKEEIQRLNFAAKQLFEVGDAIPDVEVIESHPFAQLPEAVLRELRGMDVQKRFDRKLTIAFRTLSLKEALLKLELRAYFH